MMRRFPSLRRWQHAIAAALLPSAFLPPRNAGAQDATSITTVRPWLVGIGAEALEPLRTRLDGIPLRTGIAAQVGYERALGRSPFGLRLGASYVSRPRDDGLATNAFGIGATTTYALSAGSVRPYLLAGLGADAVTDGFRGSASAGIGTLVRIGRVWSFAEARLTTFPTFGAGPQRQPLGVLPVTLGFRF